METRNPVLKPRTFSGYARTVELGEGMTIQGTVNKTGFLLLLAFASSAWVWRMFYTSGDASTVVPYVLVGAIAGLVVALVTVFRQAWAPITAPLYALLEGLVLGGVSAVFASQYRGIVLQAVGLTFGVLACMLLAYKSGLIRATEKFKVGVVAATGGIVLLYVASLVLGFFGVQIPGLFGNGPIGILFSLVVVGIAALNLVLDFDAIERGAAGGAPKYMEWFGAFALMITLVWLYLEILRLLSKFQSRR
ncbi:MAG: Bax inhibitor-1/YccA family protein [Acidobacteria bacterium]|nr:MAG: Bax inhibitor-1/YccA family protein [Acidobacteriota bacterium]